MPTIEGWFRAEKDIIRAYARSEVQPFPSHFVPTIPADGSLPKVAIGHARCPVDGCQLCAYLPREDHGLVVVQWGPNRRLQLVELRPRHAHTLSEARALGLELIGYPLFIWRDTNEHGEPVEISLDRPDFAPRSMQSARLELKAVPCERFCAAIGRKPYERALAVWDRLLPLLEDARLAQLVA